MDKKYYLGIDGGGTKTAFIVIDENNGMVYQNVLGPSSLDTVSLSDIEKLLLTESKNIPYKISAIFAGIGGISCDNDKKLICNILCKFDCLLPSGKVEADNDVINALYGALCAKDGIVIIAGTGSVAFGKWNSKYARSGGYCYQEGDAGSAYYIGYRALQYLARVIDGRKEESTLSKELIEITKCNDYSSLASYFVNATRTQIAKLSPVVCNNKSKEAIEIVEDAVNEMIEMIIAVHKRLEIQNSECLFSIIGSLGNNSELYKGLLLNKLEKINPNIKFIDKMHDASFGAALKAKSL